MGTNVNIAYLDYDGERGSFGYRTEAIATDGSNWAAINTALAAFRVATSAITLGSEIENTISEVDKSIGTPATDPNSNREAKWLVTYVDSQQYLDPPTNSIPNPGFGKRFNVELPCADLSLRVGNSEIVYNSGSVGVTAVDTWVGLFEADALSPYGGTVTVLEVRSVGRNT